ncbi:hypothetical protein BH695_2712 [Microcystis aeruginosa PCC 7806SL]|uniref:Uncharacterized protein n=1 Tax=Microcystis aeruginosa PCC 7806SL TaxID=1903187 RepID=A0AB33C1G7_MICA7|nr:hypothetical protein BH695_2712 [Microcystis aeruginosa PCC 7806SL]
MMSEDLIKLLEQFLHDNELEWEWFEKIGFFGFCYVMYGGYKGRNPYREKRLAIFVNCF